ncbi:PKD domain-containing protein [Dyadobacter tibetensis]|uniref:PKD domain-containing protein n=1 Tax=Dyadobacter tibetensis TaxID=1211851 RepID=UPI0004AEFD8D|nr:PKD domain-containing protein [Dyadobacter tibetensis]
MILSIGSAQAQFVISETCVPSPYCAENGTVFSDMAGSTATGWLWTFSNGQSATTRSTIQPFITPGKYSATLTRTFADGSSTTETQSFTIGTLPPDFTNWEIEKTICPGEILELDPYKGSTPPPGATYLWAPNGETTQTIQVDKSDCYSVQVTILNDPNDPNSACTLENLINVNVCQEPANQQGAKWFFGENAGLDFSNSPPTPITDGKLNTPEGTSSISNTKGDLMFYSDGISVFDKDGNVMPCSSGPCQPLPGSPTSTQSVLIVPQPTCKGCEYLYNVFTTSEINGTKLLTVSTVDMRQNSGNGAIISQNTTLQQPTTERLASVRNDADSSYWIISHDSGTNLFRIFHSTTAGLIETGTQALGMAHDTPEKGEGYMKFSSSPNSNGERLLAIVIPGPPNNYVEIFTFNDETGVLTFNRTLDLGPAPPKAYGVEFSPDGEKLFVSFQGDGTEPSSLRQYDITIADDQSVVDLAEVLDTSPTEKYGALQLAGDGKIYMAIEGSTSLAVIGDPNGGQIAGVDYERVGVQLGGKKSQLGLPNMVANFSQQSSGSGFQAEGFCTGVPTSFEAGPICDPLEDISYVWDFGDGTVMPSKDAQIDHTYTAPGNYTVTLTQTNQCTVVTTSQVITIYETPLPISLPDIIEVLCDDETLLDMGVVANGYVWIFNGKVVGRGKTLNVKKNQQGKYVAIAYNDPDANCYSEKVIDVFFRTVAPFDLGPDLAICRNTTETILAPGNSWASYLWNTGATSSSIIVSQAGNYEVEVTDRNGCKAKDNILVTELPFPKTNLLPQYFICFPDKQTLSLDATGTNIVEYSWTPTGSKSPIITVDEAGIYEVTLKNTSGCLATEKIEAVEQCEPRFFIPDAFTPDGQGQNETLEVFGAYFKNFTIRIYNRWGEVIFASDDYENKWDGTYKGLMVQPGAYPYVITYEALYFPDRAPVVKRGSVMLIR